MIVEVTLTPDELWLAVHVGAHRHITCLRAGSVNRFNNGTEWSSHIDGAAAELAVAKYLNRYWSGLEPIARNGDVGKVQVRHTSRPDGALIVRPNEVEGNPLFVLVTGFNGVYKLIGLMRAADAQRDEWARNPNEYGAAWFVPQSALQAVPER